MASGLARCDNWGMLAGGVQPSRPAREIARLHRRPDRALLGGVCAGVAEHLGTDVRAVRLGASMLFLVGGLGIAVYLIAFVLIPVSPAGGRRKHRPRAWRDGLLIVAGLTAIYILLRATGLLVSDSVILPLILGTCGLALGWRPIIAPAEVGGESNVLSSRGMVARLGRIDAPRLILSALLVAFAAAGLLHAAGVLDNLGRAIGVVAIVATVLGLLFVPWFVRLASSLAFERSFRIREQERAELAAHLHDSVLQTLALIQQRADEPREVAGLARRQERELRDWLLDRHQHPREETVAGALERAAAEIEELHRVPIEVVTVGDLPLDEGLNSIIQAAREAMTNAARFAGTNRVDIYAEVEPDRVGVFIRDRGVGFDIDAIPRDRRGVRDSIIGRMERNSGQAHVRSMVGEGTEIELVIARS